MTAHSPVSGHCHCLSGLTEEQVKLLELRGALQVVTWLASEAKAAHDAPPNANPEVAAYLERLTLGLTRAEDFCRVHGWKGGGR